MTQQTFHLIERIKQLMPFKTSTKFCIKIFQICTKKYIV